jgi:hypothetical protein
MSNGSKGNPNPKEEAGVGYIIPLHLKAIQLSNMLMKCIKKYGMDTQIYLGKKRQAYEKN